MIIVGVYLLFLAYAVLRLFRAPARDEADYLVAGRRLTLPAFVATTVATWYGGILGVGEYAWTYGVSNWLVFGLPYYLYALVFALVLARRARRGPALTMPDLLQERYGTRTAVLGATVIFVMTVPAAYVLMLGVLFEMATGWPLWLGVALGTALSVGYVMRGGLRAVVGTDIVQFVLMFLGFLVLVPVCVAKFGGWDFLRDALPPQHLTWHGGRGFQAVAVWYVIAASTAGRAGLLPALQRRARRAHGPARPARLDPVLGPVRLPDHHGGPLRARRPARPRGAGGRVPAAGGGRPAAAAAGPVPDEPAGDDHVHGRFLRLHRRDHRRPRRLAAPQNRRLAGRRPPRDDGGARRPARDLGPRRRLGPVVGIGGRPLAPPRQRGHARAAAADHPRPHALATAPGPRHRLDARLRRRLPGLAGPRPRRPLVRRRTHLPRPARLRPGDAARPPAPTSPERGGG
ncbi:MAG: hypothetical protein IPI34_03325 [bacterium]|nr:hypothetical protein [bacterium]